MARTDATDVMNAKIESPEDGKVKVSFDKGGTVRCSKHEFRDREDLIKYLSQWFPLRTGETGAKLRIIRTGKYQRVDAKNAPIFTFGDILLDLMTNEMGKVVLNGRTHDLRARALTHRRRGGIRSIDLHPYRDELRRHQVARAVLGEGNSILLNCDGDRASMANLISTKPKEDVESSPSPFVPGPPRDIDFWDGGDHMRFHAYDDDYWVGWAIGAEIETWGADFTYARVDSQFGYAVTPGALAACAAAGGIESDSDSNTDIISATAWGLFGEKPHGVVSECTADWKGRLYNDTVGAGGCAFWV